MLKPKNYSNLISRQIAITNTNQLSNLTQTLLNLLKRCTSVKSLQQIHTQMLINSIQKPNYFLPKIINLKNFTYASLFFSQIPNPNDYSFNIMIRGLTTTWKNYPLAIQFYYQMRSLCVKPDNFTFPFVFISCGNLCALHHGQIAHCTVFMLGLVSDSHVSHSLITMYAKCGQLGYAYKVFDEILERDLVSWNSIISGYSKMGFGQEAVRLFMEMREDGFEPDEMSLVSVLGACGDLGDLMLGRWIEGFVSERNVELNSYIGSALIGMYCKCGDLLSARRVFDAMAKKDIVTWNAMITGYAQNGASNEAIILFNVMREAGINPDKITLVGVLSACASIGALDVGKWVETYASQRGFEKDVYVASALVDMFAKCGNLDNALKVFENMPHKNEVSWNAMISALAFHGRAQEALSLFRRMLTDSTAQPNDITFIGVLSACVHAGLVNEGRQFFDSMKSSFGLVPKIEHFSCMVDLLARTGLLYEAWDFIEKMPGKPDEIILGSLLGACQKYKNVDISERVIKLLLLMEPSNSGNYIISSKIYANSKRWEDSANMRVLMRQRGVTKIPGCSWVEFGAQVHEFHAGDMLHHDSVEIYQLLNDEMKRLGYTPKVG
ncbi:pentatricopeptide repeat-containing protein At2g34400 [Mercurialis annua]|uniref:pentatricopeptide repeat-containing protein At2g34400 n=1 Tax=Mercurialis annua TaxID=3986 RepID=UPI002160FEDB|nr:pentatricopeptide repeat-containing protein At2g34400 [Mercurialis annua]XP_050215836.1 pentatricopeptide repeat-containing protein At2g34400 [Mercurialis annua]